MTAYFDALTQEVTELSGQCERTETFIECLAPIEERAARDLSLMTGDREFPDTWRERLLGIAAVRRVGQQPRTTSELVAAATRTSPFISELHRAMHRLAAERIQTRWGRITDDPAANNRCRDSHDES